MENDGAPSPSAAAMAQSRGDNPPPGEPPMGSTDRKYPGEDEHYRIGPRVAGAVRTRPYQRKPGDPIYRPLRIYSVDPTLSRFEGAVATVKVPYEPLPNGPEGSLFSIRTDSVTHGAAGPWQPDAPTVLIRQGRDPSPTDPQFHQQMAYAVCSLVYAAFRSALGRTVSWSTETGDTGETVTLKVLPHGTHAANAYYDKRKGRLVFGYYDAGDKTVGRTLRGGNVYTCLSHDIVAHEVTHALLDGLRAHFAFPSGPQVLAFHEAFADLVALFVRFSHEEVVYRALQETGGRIEDSGLLTGLGQQMGQTTGSRGALRSAITRGDGKPGLQMATAEEEPHKLGSVLVAAVFDAFITVYRRRIRPYVRLATGGTGQLPPGDISEELCRILAHTASRIASHFLNICIRAVDYCPPVDLEFGEYLRALITADYDLVPDDHHGYREALVDSFLSRGIQPSDVPDLSEQALLWEPLPKQIGRLPELDFATLRFAGDPAQPSGAKELRRQAAVLGHLVAQPDSRPLFGLAAPDDPALNGDSVDLPYVESIRTSRRVGPDGQIVFDLVAEITQRRRVAQRPGPSGEAYDFFGGCTVIIDPAGAIRFVISKQVLNQTRLERQRAFITSEQGQRYWERRGGRLEPKQQLWATLHDCHPAPGMD